MGDVSSGATLPCTLAGELGAGGPIWPPDALSISVASISTLYELLSILPMGWSGAIMSMASSRIHLNKGSELVHQIMGSCGRQQGCGDPFGTTRGVVASS